MGTKLEIICEFCLCKVVCSIKQEYEDLVKEIKEDHIKNDNFNTNVTCIHFAHERFGGGCI